MSLQAKSLFGRTPEEWRVLLASLSKNGSLRVAESFDMLQDVCRVANSILQETCPMCESLQAVKELFLPISKVLVSLHGVPPESVDMIDQTLELICRACCFLFQRQNCQRSAQTLLVVTDSKKPLWKQELKGQMVVTVTAPTGNSKTTGLDIIPEIPEQFQSICQQDLSMAQIIVQDKVVVLKRNGLRQGYSKIVQVVLTNTTCIESSFAGRPLEFVVKLVQILVNVMRVVATQHLSRLFKHVCQSLRLYFQRADQNVIRSMTKELLQSLLPQLESVFDRLCQVQKYQWLESFVVQITLPMIRCQMLKKKIVGVKILGQICNQVSNSKTKYLRDQNHKAWIVDNRVFEEIFTLDNHEQVIQSGCDILKYMVRTQILQNNQLLLLLNLIENGNASLRKILLKTLSQLTLRYSHAQIQTILTQMDRIRASLFNQQMIYIVAQVSKYSSLSHKKKSSDILYKLITQNMSQFKSYVQEDLLKKYIDLLRSSVQSLVYQGDNQFKPMEYFDSILDLPLEVYSLKLAKKVLDLFPQSNLDSNYIHYRYTTLEMITYLVEQKHIHQTLIECINTTSDEKLCETALEFLSLIMKGYKEGKVNDKFLSVDLLRRLAQHPKVFCHLLYYYDDQSVDQLFATMVTNPVSSIQNLACLKELMYIVNKSRSNMTKVLNDNESSFEVNVLPEFLEGYHQFMALALNTENQQVRNEVCKFVCKLHCSLCPELLWQKDRIVKTFVQSILSNIRSTYEVEHQELKLLGCLGLLESMMNETETQGVGKLVSHSSLVNTQSVRIVISNEITFGYDIPRSLDTKFPSNQTLFQMLKSVGRTFKCTPQDILLKLKDREIEPTCNGLTIQELGLKDKVLNAYKRTRPSIPKSCLMVEDKLTTQAIQVFSDIFHQFSPSGNMVPAELAKFVEASTNDSCSENDYRVVELFNKYDTNGDNIIQVDCFISFFEESCKTRQNTVWRNLESLRIRPDLKKYTDVKEQVNNQTMARCIIYNSSEFDILFQLTHNQKLKENAIRLIKRLPTSQKIIRDSLENINFDLDDQFMYWYKLTLIEWMIHDNPVKKQDEIAHKELQQKFQVPKGQKQEDWLTLEDPPKLLTPIVVTTQQESENTQTELLQLDAKLVSQWKERFLSNKMYIKVLEQAENISKVDLSAMSKTDKTCLLLCFQILRRLCKVPELQQSLPSSGDRPQITLIDLPESTLASKLIPQLFSGQINTQLLEPLLCLLLSKPQVDLDLISRGLFHGQTEVRVVTTNFLYLHQRIHNYNIDVFRIEPQSNCQEFFGVLAKVILEDDRIDLAKTFCRIFTQVSAYKVGDQIGDNRPDYLFEGKLSIMHNILMVQPNITVDSEFQRILLQKLDDTLVPSTREILYNLLLKTPKLGILKYLTRFIGLIEPKKPSMTRNYYVGLYNLGCICYMTAMLQQFYMTDEFRLPLLALDTQRQIPLASQKGKEYKDSVLEQLQRMFVNLELSQRSQYNPEEFCYSFKRNIQFGIQQDAQEFLGALFERLEDQLKGTCFADLVGRVYGGKTIATITCSRCKKPKYKVQDFNNVQLQVKDRKNIDESLTKFCQEETINDYECEFCQTKVQSMTKSIKLYSLPNILIIHLMRMVFNLETYERVKLHNRLEFQQQLDVSEYIGGKDGEEAPERSQCMYRLKGVVVHSGCAESGHYYSLIKVDNEWFKFDDSKVTPFNVNDLPDQTFGGQEEYNDWGVTGNSRSKNAYMLIYQKTQKKPWVVRNLTQRHKEQIQILANCQQVRNQEGDNQDYGGMKISSFGGLVRRDLKAEVSKDHEILFQELQLYNQNFFKFVKTLIERAHVRKEYFDEIMQEGSKAYTLHPHLMTAEDIETYSHLLQLLARLTHFFSKAPSSDSDLIKTMIPFADMIFFLLPDQAEKFIMSLQIKKHLQVLVSHPDGKVRDLYRVILNRCFNVLIQRHNIDLNSQSDQSPDKTRLLSILEQTLGLLYTDVPKNSNKLEQYFQFWKVFSFSSRDCMRYCFNKDFIALMIDFLMEKKTPVNINPGNYNLNSKFSSPPIFPLLETLAGLVMNSNSLGQSNQLQEGSMHILNENDRKCLTCLPFYKMMIQQKQDYSGLIIIIRKLVENNLPFSQEVAVFLMNGINKSERYDSALAYMMIISGYLSVDDQYYRHRLQWILGVPQMVESSPSSCNYAIKGTIRNQSVQYISALFAGKTQSYKSVLELLFSQRKNPDSFSVTGVEVLLNLLATSPKILQYVITLPPPDYCYAKYIDWIPPFVDSFQKNGLISLLGDKEKVAQKCYVSLIAINQSVQKLIGRDPGDVVLRSMRPLTIIGKTYKLEPMEQLLLENDKNQVKISGNVVHTFVVGSKPTGDDNLSLPKDLFQQQSNYQSNPLKYYVQKEEMSLLLESENQSVQILPEADEGIPEVRASLISLRVETDTSIIISSKNPEFDYTFYFTPGSHSLNLPYVQTDIQGLIGVRFQEFSVVQGPTQKKQQGVQSTEGDYYSSMQQQQYGGYYIGEDCRKTPCPDCTFMNNSGSSICEVCQYILSSF